MHKEFKSLMHKHILAMTAIESFLLNHIMMTILEKINKIYVWKKKLELYNEICCDSGIFEEN